MHGFKIRTRMTEISAQLAARIPVSALVPKRLSTFIQRIPWLAEFPASHPRITKVAIYWLVAAVMAYMVMLIQAAPTMVGALLQGGFLPIIRIRRCCATVVTIRRYTAASPSAWGRSG